MTPRVILYMTLITTFGQTKIPCMVHPVLQTHFVCARYHVHCTHYTHGRRYPRLPTEPTEPTVVKAAGGVTCESDIDTTELRE